MRIFATADLPAEVAANGEWLAGLSRADYKQDALVVAGDVAHQLAEVEATLAGLLDCFATVFLCHKLGVRTTMRTCAWPTVGAVGPMRWRKSPEIYS